MNIICFNLEEQAKRYSRPLSALCILFDQYQAIKEQQGISVVANIMKTLVEILNTLIRNCDLLSVFDNSKVVVLLPETSSDGVKVLKDRLQLRFNEHNFIEAQSEVSISFGSTTFGEGKNVIDKEIIKNACKLAEEKSSAKGN